jgi:hypothetical protein
MLTMTLTGLEEAKKKLGTAARQLPFAAATALNATAFDARAAVVKEKSSVFDRPTPFIQKGTLVRKATKTNLVAEVYEDFQGPGGKSVDPERVLRAEVFGGARRYKRAEVALQRIGVMLPGQILVPGGAAPLDAYGNVPGPFIVRLLSYFQAFGEQGYRANMTERNRRKLSGRGRWVNSKFVPATAKNYDAKAGAKAQRRGGVEYFVSHGRGERNGRQQHLPAGIWQRRGLHGEDIAPVFLFVDQGGYTKRLDFFGVVRTTALRQWPQRLDEALAQAMRTAR